MRKRHAFTLVELLVVIGIIALLIALLLPALNRARYQAKVVTCASQIRQLAQAFNIYAAQHRGKFPRFDIADGGGTNLWDVAVEQYDRFRTEFQVPHEVFFCPLGREELPDYFWSEPGPVGFYRLGYAFWIPHTNGGVLIPPAQGDGSGLFVPQAMPIAGPAYQGEKVAVDNPIVTDIVLSLGVNGVVPPYRADGIPPADRYWNSHHILKDRIESMNVGYSDGHVDRINGGEAQPRFISGNNYWNWR